MINKKNTCSVLDIKLKKMKDIKFNKNLFVTMKTKTIVDSILSTEGGVFPGTNTIVIGDPGVGKSTVLLDWIANLNASGKKVLFISGEMNEIDIETRQYTDDHGFHTGWFAYKK